MALDPDVQNTLTCSSPPAANAGLSKPKTVHAVLDVTLIKSLATQNCDHVRASSRNSRIETRANQRRLVFQSIRVLAR
jgi:hypothetical protein